MVLGRFKKTIVLGYFLSFHIPKNIKPLDAMGANACNKHRIKATLFKTQFWVHRIIKKMDIFLALLTSLWTNHNISGNPE